VTSRAGPRLLAIGGPIASGKSTLARALAAQLEAELLSADALREALHREGSEGALLPGFSTRVYVELFARAAQELAQGRNVVLDGSFRTRELRARARELAAEQGATFRFVECRASLETCRERLRRREEETGHSGWLEMFEHFLPLWEPVSELDPPEHVIVDTELRAAQDAAPDLKLEAP
jgi:predicted kinase